MNSFGLILSLLSLCFVQLASSSSSKERKKDDEPNYYEMYEMMDLLRAETGKTAQGKKLENFYELVGVKTSASQDEISKAFRKLSMRYHPDKVKADGGDVTEELVKLVQYAGRLLKDETTRKQYDWLLNDAPAWHRQTFRYVGNIRKSGKVTLKQSIILFACLAVLLPLVGQWVGWATALYNYMTARKIVREMGDKEAKRLKKKLSASNEPGMLAMNNDDYWAIVVEQIGWPEVPRPWHIWLFRLPLFAVSSIATLIGSKNKKE